MQLHRCDKCETNAPVEVSGELRCPICLYPLEPEKIKLPPSDIKADPRNPNTYQVGGNHYKDKKIQHWDYVLSNNIPYLEAQVIKYVSRWRDKNGVEDLLKARHFLDKLIFEETGE